ncbi:MAG: MFS transporter [Promethearchaeota archaeon]|jgi:MFS family permease
MNETRKFTADFNRMIRIVMLNTMGFFFLDYLIPVVTSQIIGASGLEIGLLFAVQTLGHTISSFFVGFLTDKVKHKKILIMIGSFGRGSAYFLLYFALLLNSLFLIGIGTFSLGFLAGFYWIPLNTLISEKSRKQNRSEAFGKREASMGRGTLLGSVIGFVIFGFTFNYNIPSISYLGIIIFGMSNWSAGFLFLKVDESNKITDDEVQNSRELENGTKPKSQSNIFAGFIFMTLVLFLGSINGSIGRPFFNVFILEEIINDPTIAMLAFVPSGFVSLFLAPKLGAFADKLKPSVGIGVFSFLGSIVTWFLIFSPNIIIFAILLVIDMTIISTGALVFQNFLSRISISKRGKVMGVQSLFNNIGAATGPIMGGILWDYLGNSAPFIVSIIVELSLIPFYLIAVYLMKPHLTEKYSQEILY